MSAQSISVRHGPDGIVFNPEFEQLLNRNGLHRVDSAMFRRGGDVIKHAVAERSTVKLTLPDTGGSVSVYLKRHHAVPLWKLLARAARPGRVRDACDEFQSILDFHAAGLPTMVPIAAGRRRAGLFKTETFLITLALEDCLRLDHYLLQRQPLAPDKKRDLIDRLARLVRTMHNRGFNHRDLYLCHILRHASGTLYLVDLHRVQQHNSVPQRWKIKDLAALNYSVPVSCITRADRLRFLKTYFGVQRLEKDHRKVAAKIFTRTKKMQRHEAKRHPHPSA